MAKKILIVDDEPHVVKALELALSGQGFELVTAASADEAWKLVDEKLDLILLDIMMPGMRPIDLLKNIKEHGLSNVKCIYVTAVPFPEEDKAELMSGGQVVDFIEKPFDNADLLSRVKAALGA